MLDEGCSQSEILVAALDGVELDPNLTYSIIVDPSINATLNPAPSNLIKDWLPSIISIVVVIVGGLITYQSAFRLERQKRRYELKKEAYFDALNAIIKVKRGWEDLERAEERRRLSSVGHLAIDSNKIFADLIDVLRLQQMKMKVCANPEINKYFDDALMYAKNTEDHHSFNTVVFDNLIPAMRKDLMESQKQWWQFWIR